MTSGTGQYRPNPYRRGIAHAIMLEQAWDRLASFGHCGPPPFDRIVPQDANRTRERRHRLVLPRPLTDDKLRRLHEERAEAIRELHGSLSATMSSTEGRAIDMLCEESTTIEQVEQHHVVDRRRHVRSIGDASEVVEDVSKLICDEADRPQSTPSSTSTVTARAGTEAKGRTTSVLERDSISIDVVLHSLIERHRVDRDALHREIASIRRMLSNPQITVELHSPRSRSNTGRTLTSLGPDFPPAALRLVGVSIDVLRIELDPIGGSQARWSYAISRGNHSFSTPTRDEDMRLWNMPGRSLRVALEDDTWHPSLIVESALEWSDTNATVHHMQGARIVVHKGRTNLDPPGSPPPIVHGTLESREAMPATQQRTGRWRHLDSVPVVEAALDRAGHRLARRIELVEGKGLRVRMAKHAGGPLQHVYPIDAETIDDGVEAIEARVAQIVARLASRRSERPMKAIVAGAGPIPVSDAAKTKPLLPPDPAQLLGLEGVGMLETCSRTDALLADVLQHDPVGTAPELHMQEGVLCVSKATLAPGVRYRLERFDRTLGKPTHAIAVVEIDRALTAATVERLRDGSIGIVVQTWPAFAASQVRKVSRDEISTLVTIRVPLVDR